MKKISDIKELRLIQMDIMSYVDKVCRENGIEYSLAGGTLIGAVRHRGYIPWDDDIDIMLTRVDYDKLIDVMSRKADNGETRYQILTHSNDKSYTFPFAKVIDTNTLLVENAKGKNLGVFVDIFPVDYIPENFNRLLRPMRFLYNLQTLKRLKVVKNRAFIKNFVLVVLQVLLSLIPIRLIIKRMDTLARNSNQSVSSLGGVVVWGYGKKEIVPYKIHKAHIDIAFEDRVYRSIEDYDVYLTAVYGNYMALPPIEKRITHHDFEAYWKD